MYLNFVKLAKYSKDVDTYRGEKLTYNSIKVIIVGAIGILIKIK